MKLWILRPVEPCQWDHLMDCNFGFVVRAKDEASARKEAESRVADEEMCGAELGVWTDPKVTTCVPLTNKGAAGIVMADFLSA